MPSDMAVGGPEEPDFRHPEPGVRGFAYPVAVLSCPSGCPESTEAYRVTNVEPS